MDASHIITIIDAAPITVQATGEEKISVVFEISHQQGGKKVVDLTSNHGFPIGITKENVTAKLAEILSGFVEGTEQAATNAARTERIESAKSLIAEIKGKSLDELTAEETK